MSELATLEASIMIEASPETVFEALLDIEGRTREMPSFRGIEVRERSEEGFVATMFEHYGGRDVVVTSRFRFARPSWLSYEHLESPYGENRGRFTLAATEQGGTMLHQLHETVQDVSEGTTLRGEWLALMQEQLASVARSARRLSDVR